MIFARRETALILIGDVLLLSVSLWGALFVRSFEIPTLTLYLVHLWGFLLVFAISILVFFIAGLYEKQARLVRSVMVSRVIGAQAANTILAAVVFFLLPFSIAPKTVLFLYLIISVASISFWRFLAVPYFSLSKRQKAVLVAGGPAASELYQEIMSEPKYYIEFIAHINPDTYRKEDLAHSVEAAVKSGAHLIVIDSRDARIHGELAHLYDVMLEGAAFAEFATFYEGIFDRVPLDHIDHAWLLECLPRGHFGYDLGKWVFDRVLAACGIVVSVFLVLPAVFVLLATGGHPFIYPERIGRGGKIIRLVKLRTMLFFDNGDPKLQEKNRVTRFGAFLRKSRIDELPQLFNVLRGELSFIGPRPELPKIAETYRAEIPFYEARHLITPGLSGWAQIRDYDAPRGPADVLRTRRKLSYDLYYLKRRSFVLDVVIALKTIRSLIIFSGK